MSTLPKKLRIVSLKTLQNVQPEHWYVLNLKTKHLLLRYNVKF